MTNRIHLPEPAADLNKEEQVKAVMDHNYQLALQLYYVNKEPKKEPRLPKNDFRRQVETSYRGSTEYKTTFLLSFSLLKKEMQKYFMVGSPG